MAERWRERLQLQRQLLLSKDSACPALRGVITAEATNSSEFAVNFPSMASRLAIDQDVIVACSLAPKMRGRQHVANTEFKQPGAPASSIEMEYKRAQDSSYFSSIFFPLVSI
jgi:hypothetical protein